jgi:WD40 repeat protein
MMKCRQNPENSSMIASVTTSGVVNLYKTNAFEWYEHVHEGKTQGSLVGKLHGLHEETFCLNWSRCASNLLASAAGNHVCIWDINRTNGTETEKMPHGDKHQLMKFMNAHGDNQVNDAKFSPLNPNYLVTAGSDGFFKVWDLRDNGYKHSFKCSSSKD